MNNEEMNNLLDVKGRFFLETQKAQKFTKEFSQKFVVCPVYYFFLNKKPFVKNLL